MPPGPEPAPSPGGGLRPWDVASSPGLVPTDAELPRVDPIPSAATVAAVRRPGMIIRCASGGSVPSEDEEYLQHVAGARQRSMQGAQPVPGRAPSGAGASAVPQSRHAGPWGRLYPSPQDLFYNPELFGDEGEHEDESAASADREPGAEGGGAGSARRHPSPILSKSAGAAGSGGTGGWGTGLWPGRNALTLEAPERRRPGGWASSTTSARANLEGCARRVAEAGQSLAMELAGPQDTAPSRIGSRESRESHAPTPRALLAPLRHPPAAAGGGGARREGSSPRLVRAASAAAAQRLPAELPPPRDLHDCSQDRAAREGPRMNGRRLAPAPKHYHVPCAADEPLAQVRRPFPRPAPACHSSWLACL